MSDATTPKPKAKKRREKRKLSALFLLGSDGEVYATCPLPTPPVRMIRNPEYIMAIRLTRKEREIALDAIHTDGVIEAARTLAGIIRPDA